MDAGDIFDDEEGLCGWGAADFDDDLLGRGRRKEAPPVVSKGAKKKHSNPDSELPSQNKPQQQPSPENQFHENSLPARHKSKRNQVIEKMKPQRPQSPKPSSRTTSILEENAAIAALGRQRRLKVVAAAMATKVPRKSGMGNVVSAAFDRESDGDEVEPEITPRRRPDQALTQAAPLIQQEKLPRVDDFPASPIGPTEVLTNIHLPLPLPSINPDFGSNQSMLSGKNEPDEPALQAPRRYRRRRQQKQKKNLLPSRDASENWEANFPMLRRRFRSPKENQADSASETAISDVVPTSYTRVDRVPEAPRQVEYTTAVRTLLPSIHQTTKESRCTALLDEVAAADTQKSKFNLREGEDDTEEDDESWTNGYEDPEVISNSMAGLIQALSTFGKNGKASKGRKSKKRRAKLQFSQHGSVNHSMLRFPPPREVNVTSIRDPRQHEVDVRRRKHRKLRNLGQVPTLVLY